MGFDLPQKQHFQDIYFPRPELPKCLGAMHRRVCESSYHHYHHFLRSSTRGHVSPALPKSGDNATLENTTGVFGKAPARHRLYPWPKFGGLNTYRCQPRRRSTPSELRPLRGHCMSLCLMSCGRRPSGLAFSDLPRH